MLKTIIKRLKQLASIMLAALIIFTVFPATVFAAKANLGKVSGASKIGVTAEMNYGHDIKLTEILPNLISMVG